MQIQNRYFDYVGFTKGVIQILENAGSNRNGRLWKCKCTVCGFERVISTARITGNEFKKCNCKRFKKNRYEECDNFYKIFLVDSDEFFICDKDDFNKFYFGNSFCKDGKGYIICDGKKFHRLIMNIDDSRYDVDHKNGNKLDNRKKNLRICKHSQNSKNKAVNKNNKSGIVGVYWNNRCGKWVAEIKVDYKRISLGYFDDINEAADARRKAEIKYFGEYSIQKSRDGEYVPKTLEEIIENERLAGVINY